MIKSAYSYFLSSAISPLASLAGTIAETASAALPTAEKSSQPSTDIGK